MEPFKPRRIGERFSKTQLRDFNKNYPTYFGLTTEAKRIIAASLGVPKSSLNNWMWAKRIKDKVMGIRPRQFQTTYEQERDRNPSGIIVTILFI